MGTNNNLRPQKTNQALILILELLLKKQQIKLDYLISIKLMSEDSMKQLRSLVFRKRQLIKIFNKIKLRLLISILIKIMIQKINSNQSHKEIKIFKFQPKKFKILNILKNLKRSMRMNLVGGMLRELENQSYSRRIKKYLILRNLINLNHLIKMNGSENKIVKIIIKKVKMSLTHMIILKTAELIRLNQLSLILTPTKSKQ